MSRRRARRHRKPRLRSRHRLCRRCSGSAMTAPTAAAGGTGTAAGPAPAVAATPAPSPTPRPSPTRPPSTPAPTPAPTPSATPLALPASTRGASANGRNDPNPNRNPDPDPDAGSQPGPDPHTDTHGDPEAGPVAQAHAETGPVAQAHRETVAGTCIGKPDGPASSSPGTTGDLRIQGATGRCLRADRPLVRGFRQVDAPAEPTGAATAHPHRPDPAAAHPDSLTRADARAWRGAPFADARPPDRLAGR